MNPFLHFYNNMAFIIQRIMTYTDESFFEQYIALGSKRRAEIRKELETNFPEVIKAGQVMEITLASQWNEDFFQRLEAFVSNCESVKEMQLLVCLVSKLDIALSKRSELYLTIEAPAIRMIYPIT